MASLSGWTTENPANTSVWSQIDDQYRSDKSVERNVWEAEHYWDSGSAASAGYHKAGSLRPYHGPASELSQAGDEGRAMLASDASSLYNVSHGSTPLLLSRYEPIFLYPDTSDVTPALLVPNFSSNPAGWLIAAGDIRARVFSLNTTVTSRQTGYMAWLQSGLAAVLDVGVRINGGNHVNISGHEAPRLSVYTVFQSELT